jgi:hypothetical protein
MGTVMNQTDAELLFGWLVRRFGDPSELTAERLRKLLSYNPDTGIFTWLVTKSPKAPKGSQAGTIKTWRGYSRYEIRVEGRDYFAHRLAWFYMTGEWPQDQIDHRDGNSLNNRWSNLRPATQSQNNANTKPKKAGRLKGTYLTRIGTRPSFVWRGAGFTLAPLPRKQMRMKPIRQRLMRCSGNMREQPKTLSPSSARVWR